MKAATLLNETPPLEEVLATAPVYRPKEDPSDFIINREGENKWRLSGAGIERAAAMTQWEHDGSIRRFQQIMATLGVDSALRKAGVEEGDTVIIGDYELEWQ